MDHQMIQQQKEILLQAETAQAILTGEWVYLTSKVYPHYYYNALFFHICSYFTPSPSSKNPTPYTLRYMIHPLTQPNNYSAIISTTTTSTTFQTTTLITHTHYKHILRCPTHIPTSYTPYILYALQSRLTKCHSYYNIFFFFKHLFFKIFKYSTSLQFDSHSVEGKFDNIFKNCFTTLLHYNYSITLLRLYLLHLGIHLL